MKKILLSAALVAFAAAANAGVEVGFLDSEALGLANKPTLDDMTLLSETENVSMYFLNGQEVSAQNPDFQGFKYVVVNGEAIKLVQGIGGTSNGTGDISGPTGGCIYRLDVKKDGWMIVLSKISSNKNFYAFMGLPGEAPDAVAYTLGMDLQSSDYPEIPEIKYSLPAGEYGLLNAEAADIDKYTFGGNTIAWPIKIATENNDAASAGNGTGAMVFPVYAEGATYCVLATGSKMNTCGFVFVDSDPAGEAPNVALYCPASDGETPRAEKVVVVTGTAPDLSGVSAVEAANEDAPVYNLMGVRVNADAKGLLIQNG
ncbi:MAG: hypothetical protein K2G85_03685, partial [Muribaculaceae bacterium]|nr:hypothetical protein [Muribaculaceae bacterium]